MFKGELSRRGITDYRNGLKTKTNSAQELCENRGGRPGAPPIPNSPCSVCGRKATLNLSWTKKKWKTQSSFSLDFSSCLLKIDIWKLHKHNRCAAILCQAACVSDMANKAGMCVSSIKNIENQPFSALQWQRANQRGCTPRSWGLKPKKVLLLC